eukprot:12925291-Prorocentrum_lima.AAC.1
MGNVPGGLLRVGSKEGKALPPYTTTGLGTEVRSHHVIKRRWLNFGGTKWHGVTPTAGFILPLVFFNSKSFQR